MSDTSAREALSEAIPYWERRRILYNVVLLAVCVAVYFSVPAGARPKLGFDLLQGLFVLAVLANVAYCAAYVVDVIVQMTTLREGWLRVRWVLLLIGLAFAAILANFFSQGIVGHAP
jgi:hypothetical protein